LLGNTIDYSLGFRGFSTGQRVGTGIAKECFRNPFDSRFDSNKIRRLNPDNK
jgi:hypothetical protein